MPDIRISQLPAAGPITGAELVPIVQNGGTVQTTAAALAASPVLTQTFLTLNQEATLDNSRYLSTGTGLGLTDGGAQSYYRITLNGTSGSLESASTGIIVKDSATTVTSRSIAVGTSGLSISNGSGVAGNPTISLTGLPLALASVSGTGLVAVLASSALTPVSILGTSDEIDVANGTAAGGASPTIGLADNAIMPGTGALTLPGGTEGQRPAGAVKQIRYNSTSDRYEAYYSADGWVDLGQGDGTVSQVSGTANQIAVANGTTTPVISIVSNPTIPGSSAMRVPYGTTGERTGTPVNGLIRYNTDLGLFEGYVNGAWASFASGSGVTSVATGTGLTGGPITSTGTISIANTGVTAATYGAAASVPVIAVNAQGQITSATDTAISITASNISDAGDPNGIATLDSGGTVPLSQIPASIQGGLVYQGTWNASTNTPTLTSGVGSKGHYYVVSVAGTTNLDGITDWNIGDLAIFNGTVWEQVDNTDAVTSVNGYTGTVVLTYSDVGAANAGANTNVTSMSGLTGGIATPEYIDFDTSNSVARATGRLWWDNTDSIQTLNLGMAGSNATMQIGEELYYRIKASAAITEGQVVMFSGTVGASGGLYGAPATGLTASTASYVLGIATEDIALNDWGYVTQFGLVRGINTSGGAEAWVDGQILYYNPSVTGGLTKTAPSAPNAKIQVCAVVHASSGSSGSLFVRPTFGGTLGQFEGDVQITSATTNDVLVYNTNKWVNTAASSITIGTATNAVNMGITNDTSTNATMYPVWVTANTGNLPAKVTSTKLSFNPSTGALSSTSFVGAFNGSTVAASGDGTFTGTGQIKLPAGTVAERSGTPVNGMIRYNTDNAEFEGYSGGLWGSLGGGAVADGCIYPNGQTISNNYTFSAIENGMSVGILTIAGGATVTVTTGARWVVL